MLCICRHPFSLRALLHLRGPRFTPIASATGFADGASGRARSDSLPAAGSSVQLQPLPGAHDSVDDHRIATASGASHAGVFTVEDEADPAHAVGSSSAAAAPAGATATPASPPRTANVTVARVTRVTAQSPGRPSSPVTSAAAPVGYQQQQQQSAEHEQHSSNGSGSGVGSNDAWVAVDHAAADDRQHDHDPDDGALLTGDDARSNEL